MNWFTSFHHMFVELCNWNFRYISKFLPVGYGPVTVEMLPYSKIWGWDVNCINTSGIQRYIHYHSVILIIWGMEKYLGVALQAVDNLSIWKSCWRRTVLVALSGQIIVIVDPSVSWFERMIQACEVTATVSNLCGKWDIDKGHFSPIAWSFIAYRAVIHDDWFVRGWNGVFIQQNSPFACWQAMYNWSMIATAFVSSYVTPICLRLILY